jgi:hypothetical protein
MVKDGHSQDPEDHHRYDDSDGRRHRASGGISTRTLIMAVLALIAAALLVKFIWDGLQ